jgi:hypothetical protein
MEPPFFTRPAEQEFLDPLPWKCLTSRREARIFIFRFFVSSRMSIQHIVVYRWRLLSADGTDSPPVISFPSKESQNPLFIHVRKTKTNIATAYSAAAHHYNL